MNIKVVSCEEKTIQTGKVALFALIVVKDYPLLILKVENHYDAENVGKNSSRKIHNFILTGKGENQNVSFVIRAWEIINL